MLSETVFVWELRLASPILFDEKGKDKRGFDWYRSIAATRATYGGVMSIDHELRIYPNKRENWIFRNVNKHQNTKEILVDWTVEAWNKSEDETNILCQNYQSTIDTDKKPTS